MYILQWESNRCEHFLICIHIEPQGPKSSITLTHKYMINLKNWFFFSHSDIMPTSQDLSAVISISPKLKYFEELSHGLTESLHNSLFTDVQIEVDGETFHCHRIILASMSHYFKTMFTSSMSFINPIICCRNTSVGIW